MTNQQVTGSVREAEGPAVPEQTDAQVQAPPRLPSEPDPLAAAAVDLARQAAEDVAQPDTVGRHLSVSLDESGLTMHAFDCTAKGYRGWRWAVTLAHVPGSDRVTVCDTVLLPGAESIMAPAWVPWSDRLAPGDLGAGDELPYKLEDPYLAPGYTVTDEDEADQQLFWELGLGRERVLGREGVAAAADRWQRGPHGPTAEVAIQAAASCVSCAYFIPLSGVMRQHFGACANEWSPADGSVVTTDFGCGAHSETDLEMPAPEPLSEHILDETVVDRMDLADTDPSPGLQTRSIVDETGSVVDSAVGSAVVDELVDELGTDAAGEAGPVSVPEVDPQEEKAESAGSSEAGSPEAAASDVEALSAGHRAPQSTTAGGISSDVVSVEPTEPVAVPVEPSVDPEPVQSPEDVITVRPLGETGSVAPESSARPEVQASETAGASTAPDAVEGAPVGQIGTREVAPAEVAPGTPPAEAVHLEVAEASPGGQFVQSQPEENPAPPPALSREAVQAQTDSEAEPGETTEVAQGRAVGAVGEYPQPSEDAAELSVGAAVPGASVLESDGDLQSDPGGSSGGPEGADVAEAAQVQIGTQESPSDGEPGAAEAAAAQTAERVGEAGAGTGAEVPEDRPRHTDLGIDSAVAAAEPEPVARPVIEAAEQAESEQAESEQAQGDQAHGEQAVGEQAVGEHADGEQAVGEQADGEQADGEQAVGEQAEAEQAVGEQTDGEQADGEQADAEQADGEQTEGRPEPRPEGEKPQP